MVYRRVIATASTRSGLIPFITYRDHGKVSSIVIEGKGLLQRARVMLHCGCAKLSDLAYEGPSHQGRALLHL